MHYTCHVRTALALAGAALLCIAGVAQAATSVAFAREAEMIEGGRIAQQPDPKKKELTATVVRSTEGETLTLIAYFPEDANNIRVALYNILGKKIEVDPRTSVTKGEHSFRFQTRGLPNGPYIVVLEANGQRIVNKVMISR